MVEEVIKEETINIDLNKDINETDTVEVADAGEFTDKENIAFLKDR